ncbi:unnamed protein product [Urochloa decumbens]|uniref:chitinase n=1 Tax=Urochloa decumbens TaxID=240449 RepID=A0ABC9GDB0_9POAL
MANSPAPAIPTVLVVGLALLCAGAPSAAQNGGGADVASIVTDAFFNGIKSNDPGCEGKGFYKRQAFMNAANKYSDFAHGGSEVDGKREIAAFFAHVAHETGRMCSINEKDGASKNYCDPKYPQWPCSQGKMYYGRGPLQISWNYNYGAAGKDIGFDGLGNPDKVAQDSGVSFMSALWFWMTNVHMVMQQQGFGATIMKINSGECNGNDPDKMNDRVNYYKQYCQQLGVDTGNNKLTC